MKKLSVIIINYNTPEVTEQAIDKLCQSVQSDFELILIENGSEKRVHRHLMPKELVFINNENNLGFARAVNQGLKAAAGEYILLLNSDVLLEKDTVTILLNSLETNPSIGIVGPKLIYPDGKIQISFGRFPKLWQELIRFSGFYKFLPWGTWTAKNRFNKKLFDQGGQVDWLSGGCMLVRSEIFKRLGNLDEHYFFGVEDIDFCYKASQAGWQIHYQPKVAAVHYHGLSSGGLRSLARMVWEKENIYYFLTKNFKHYGFQAKLVRLMHQFKIQIFTYYFSLKSMKKYIPKDATIAVTYKCNSRCKMCNIWQDANPAELPLAYFYNLNPELKYINLSGGEPFLRPELPQIVEIIKAVSPHAQIIISSNGLATDLIESTMKKIMKINPMVGVRISLDGIGETHNQIRGIKDIYEHVLTTINALKRLGVKNLGFSFTIMDDNAQELLDVYDLSKKLDLQLALALVQNSDIYFHKDSNKITAIEQVKKNLNYLIKEELSSWQIKRWLRAYYDFGLLYYLTKNKRLLPSGAGIDSLFIDPHGDIYPSNLIDLKMGNLGDGRLKKLWLSDSANAVRQIIKHKKITESWIICTIRGQMRKNFLKVGWWILFRKLANLNLKHQDQ